MMKGRWKVEGEGGVGKWRGKGEEEVGVGKSYTQHFLTDHQHFDIGDEVCNVQHGSGGFIWRTNLVWPQMLFKNLVGASNSKSTKMLSYG